MASQILFSDLASEAAPSIAEAVSSSSSSGWCSLADEPVWNGIDFSPCFRSKALNGIVPLTFIILSLSSFAVVLLYRLFLRLRSAPSAIPLSSSAARRLSTSSSHSRSRSQQGRRSSFVENELSLKGPQAISQAENEVLIQVVQEESPDLRLKDILDLRKGSAGGESALDDDDDEDEEEDDSEGVSGGKKVWRAIINSKKDISNVGLSAALLVLLVLEFVGARSQKHKEGVNYLSFMVVAWGWTFLLALTKLSISFYTHLLHSRQSTSSSFYTLLELNFIPWLIVYIFPAFFNLRSSILYPSPSSSFDITIFILSSILLSIELFSPRPSRFTKDPSTSSRPIPIEPTSSLFSQATFAYIDKFMLSHAFPSLSKTPPISIETIPELRADDKTARVLLGFRQDCAVLSGSGKEKKKWSLTLKLLYHFRSELMLQQFWGYMHVVFVCLPPVFLRELLGHIAKRSAGGENAPLHVALLYAFGMFVSQILESIAASQGLYIGRRVCIRLRSILIAEIFTKALRRKDLAGSSAAKDDSTTEGGKEEKKPSENEDDEDSNEKANSGKIVNFISVDTFRVSEIAAYLHFIWPDMSLTIIVTVYLLFRVLGWSASAGVVTLILLTPLQAAASRLFYIYQKRLLAAADARLNLATEVITSIRIVKYFAWETKFKEKMEETRDRELRALWLRALTMVAGAMVMFGAPLFVSIATFVFHTKVLKRDLNAETAFTALALFNILRGPLETFTDMLVSALQSHVSLVRIAKFLDEEETSKYTLLRAPASATDPVVGFDTASFTWAEEVLAKEDPTVFRLQETSLTFPKEGLSLITGPVGSGKTTLLMSLLGETNLLAGRAFLPSPVVRSSGTDPSILTDTTAYCSQSPWLLSDTIRQNILFGSAMNEERYKSVLDVCALEPDLKQFDLGDDTEVGEKGTVLSGGQKARISLARAIYSPAKHILADDVLSAVDSHTAQHLYQKCLLGPLMNHRMMVLVTHAVDLCAPGSSFVVEMENGVVVASGPPEVVPDISVKQIQEEEAAALASSVTIEEIAAEEIGETVEAVKADKQTKIKKDLKLIQDETQSTGAVSMDVYILYLKAMGGWTLAGATLGIFVFAQVVELCVSIALRHWTESYDSIEQGFGVMALTHTTVTLKSRYIHPIASWLKGPATITTLSSGNSQTDYWLKVYCLLAGINLLLYSGRSAFFLWRGLAASRVLYTDLIGRIMAAPIRFFDSTPTGRILNRLSKDCETIDQDIAMSLTFFLLEILGVLAIILTIAVVMPAFLIAAVFITLAYWLIGYIYLASSRELKRTESVTRSPIFSLFGEALQGVATIRAYGDSARFTKQVFSLINETNTPFFCIWQANRWLSIRVDVMAAFLTLSTALFALYSKSMDAALAGFVLSLAMSFMSKILWVVRLWAVLDINFNSVERVKEYLEIDQENGGGISPPAIWPSRDGGIEVEGLTASYAPSLPPVLKGVTFSVKPREKIGIVGRTGSGKSTLGLSFFRFIEPSSGRIVIDGIDINTLNLSDLRSRLTIVAQESALFAGTLRFNLDPFSIYEDSDIWDALRRVQMAAPLFTPSASRAPSRAQSRAPSRVPSLKNVPLESLTVETGSESDTAVDGEERFAVKSLEMMVAEGGKSFSAGERQLLALARGILKLRSSSVLILDESTASLDSATDERIQKTIREEMHDATILCIAHRLRTIVDYDKILVLDHGTVLEFAAPWELLDDSSSAFAGLCKNSGEYDTLVELAYAKRDSVKGGK